MSTDIIARIDELIDEQLAAGEPENGWECGEPEYPECPHCGREWHGLPITGWGEDDLIVLCDGSDLIGPRRPPRPAPAALDAASVGVGYMRILVQIDQDTMARFRAQMEQLANAFEDLGQMWRLSIGDWFQPRPTRRGWCKDPTRPEAFPDFNWTPGPHNWHHEMRCPPIQFPRSPHPFFRYVSPTEALIQQHWDEFTAPENPLPERPEFDFTKYDLDPVHGVFAEPRRRGRR